MAIFDILSSDTPNEGKDKINDNFVDLDGRINEVELGIDAYSTTSASFVQPAVDATVSVTVDETRWMGVGQPVYMVTGGHYTVSSVTDPTTVVLTNKGYTGNASVGATVASGKKVSPGGVVGATGTTGASGSVGALWEPVRALADSTITLSGAQTIDGVSVVAGNRVLYAGGSSTERGIYVAASGAWSRATDADASGDFLQGKMVYVNEGTEHGGQIWALETSGTVTVDTTPLSFTFAPTYATETKWGLARIATQSEVDAGDSGPDPEALVNPNTLAAYTGITNKLLISDYQARDPKDSVRVATTAAGTLASSFENGDTVDGVTLATGNRILLKNQAAGAENGIYTVNASGAPTRATDANTSAKVTPQMYTRVEEGTANANKEFYLSNTGTITLGTTALTFAQVSGGGHVIQDESTPLTARTNLNFTGAGVAATDDSGNDQTDITIPGKHIVQDEGSSLTARTNLDFQGAGVTVTDNSGSDKTIVTVPAVGDPAYSTTSASFTQPSVASTVSVSVDKTAWMGVGQVVYVEGGGYYTVSSITSGTVVVLNNLGYTGNAAPAATVATAAKVSPSGLVGATGSSGYRTLVTLGSDVVNATTSFADVTGLTFSVTSGTTYRFYALIVFDVNATTTGSAWAINGPAASIIAYTAQFASTSTASSIRWNTAYDTGNASGTSMATANNLAIIEGVVKPTSSGTLAMRFASEVAVASALTAKAGSTLEWW